MKHSTPEDPITSQIGKLQRPMGGRRLLSWLLFITFLSMFLAAPIVASVWPSWFEGADSSLRSRISKGSIDKIQNSMDVRPSPAKSNATYRALDVTWNPGHIASAHRPWADDCKACHTVPFERVKDADCLACHKKMGDHVSPTIAKVDALHEVRCASCHRDHQGEFGLAEQNKRYTSENCSSCHADIKSSFAKTQTANVKDFATAHPEFRVQLATAVAEPAKLTRVRQNPPAMLTQGTNLKFPHDIHLAAAGISSPKGNVKMTCENCHTANADGKTFKPVTMKDNCQSCHALKFEPAVSNREVPHGSVAEVLTTLREFYSYVSTDRVQIDKQPENGPIFFIRPGKQERPASFVNATGDVRTRAVASATELFEKTSCVVCHQVTRAEGPGKKATPGEDMPQWKIAPIATQHAWMPNAQFTHSKHLSAKCTDCHDASKSKNAADVLMPAIKVCRDCHAGKQPEVNKVVSDCGLCHGFHMPSQSQISVLSKAHITPMVTKP